MKTPDVEYAVRQYLRTPEAGALVGPHVYFATPDDVPDAWLTLGQIGGTPTAGTTPLAETRLSISSWATTKKDAGDVARALVDLFTDIEETDIGNGVHVYGASVDLMLWQPAADTDRPRYIVDVTVHARPV